MTGNTWICLVCIISHETWRLVKLRSSDLGSGWESSMEDELSGTHMCIGDEKTVRCAKRIVATGIYFLFCSLTSWGLAAGWLMVSIGTGDECYGKIFFSLEKILRSYLSMNGVQSKMSIAKSSTTPNHNRQLKSPIRIHNKIVPSSEKGFFVAVRRFCNCCFLIYLSHYLF